MIRILLIEDLALVRESLAIALATGTDMELDCCPSVEEGIDLVNGLSGRFDIVLLKQSGGGQKADQLLSIANRNGLKVLIITTGLSDLEQRRLASLGVGGIFAKQRSLVDLICAIREVAGGETWFDKLPSKGDVPKDPASSKGRPFQSSGADFAMPNGENGTLSRQERRAAELVFVGLANKEIAVRMGVSESCIKALLQRTFLKLGVHTRGQLVRVLMGKSIGAQPPSDGPMELAPSLSNSSPNEAAQSEIAASL
jgi:DNA-binding NarL/FixJ family response regulator